MSGIIDFEFGYSFVIVSYVHWILAACLGPGMVEKYKHQDLSIQGFWATFICLMSGLMFNSSIPSTIAVPPEHCHLMTFGISFLFMTQVATQHSKIFYWLLTMNRPQRTLANQFIWIFVVMVVSLLAALGVHMMADVMPPQEICPDEHQICYIPLSVAVSGIFMTLLSLSMLIQLMYCWRDRYIVAEVMAVNVPQFVLLSVAFTCSMLSNMTCNPNALPTARLMLVLHSFWTLVPGMMPMLFIAVPVWRHTLAAFCCRRPRNAIRVEDYDAAIMEVPTDVDDDLFQNDQLEMQPMLLTTKPPAQLVDPTISLTEFFGTPAFEKQFEVKSMSNIHIVVCQMLEGIKPELYLEQAERFHAEQDPIISSTSFIRTLVYYNQMLDILEQRKMKEPFLFLMELVKFHSIDFKVALVRDSRAKALMARIKASDLLQYRTDKAIFNRLVDPKNVQTSLDNLLGFFGLWVQLVLVSHVQE